MDEGVWLSISDLARERGVDKAAVSRRVKRLEEQGLVKSRLGPKGTKEVLLAEFDRACAQTTDAVRQINGRQSSQPDGEVSPILAKEQARRASYDADLKRLELEERLGRLGRVDDFVDAMRACAEGVLQVIEQLPSRDEEIVQAVINGGAPAVRAHIRGVLIPDLRNHLERAMRALAERMKAGQAEANNDVAIPV